MMLSRLKTLNLFSSPLTATDEYKLQNERISTRLFIVILTISILIIFIYAAQAKIVENIQVKNPSYDNFQLLSLHYSQTLHCSCDNMAIPYESFIILKPQFHQLCSSQFITQQWIDYMKLAASVYLSDDFSYTGSLVFITLASFCELANKTITNSMETFKSTSFITAEALSEYNFAEQVNTIIEIFQTSVELTFYQSFDLIQFFTQTNSLLSGLLSNIILSYDADTYYIADFPRFYENNTCNCDITATCVDPMTLQDRRINQSSTSSYFTIPGLFKGCFLVEAIRQSSLKCFYESSCISTTQDFLQVPFIFNNSIMPLNSSVTSRFNISSTIDQLLSKTMTEIWQQNISHAQYFQQCKVSLCNYSITSRFNILYIVTTLIGLIGGLTKILRILIPPVVKSIRKRFVPPLEIIKETHATIPHRSLFEHLRNLNYFSKSLSNQIEIKQQIISTRIFFLMLTTSLIILISYYSAEHISYTHLIASPTFEQFIFLQNEQQSNPSLSCPCSTLAVMYKYFIHVSYDLHPFCSSDFIKLQGMPFPNKHSLLADDFRYRAGDFFNSLVASCQMSLNYIEKSLISFNTSSTIINEALSPEAFTLETNVIINKFISSTIRSFTRNLNIILNMAFNNGIMSGKKTNFAFYAHYGDSSIVIDFFPLDLTTSDNVGELCMCSISSQCHGELSIYLYNYTYIKKLFDMPGMYMGCLQTEGIRYSNLICLFNQSCVDLISFWLNISHLTAMDITSLHHFNVSSIVGEIENEMFVDKWNISTSHLGFYEQCNPNHCKYTLLQHNSIWLIVTTVFGLIGGLMKILQILVPRLVQGMFRVKSFCHRRQHRNIPSTPIVASPPFSFQRILHQLRQFNLFSSDNPAANDAYEIQNQILVTRIFIILLILSLVILTIYSSQVQVTKIVTIKNPSMEQYTSLYKSYSQTLTCPCKYIDISRQTFINLQPTFHQVCESDFVDSQWLYGIFNTLLYSNGVLVYDFRLMGTAVFRTISSLCQLSFTTINDGLLDFNAASFISIQIIPEDQFIIQEESVIDLFILTTKDAFISSLQTVRNTTYANVLLSGFETTTTVELRQVTDIIANFIMLSQTYNYSSSCTCSNDPTCIQQAGIYDSDSGTLLYAIPGIFIGCYMVEATLKSNLAFLYNQSEIDEFRQIIQFNYSNPVPFNTTALDASRYSQYNITTPINNIMQNMMTESWYKNVNYSAYYEQCQPTECKYTYTVKYDAIYIITTITALIGGLVTIYQFIIPYAIKLIRKCWLKYHRSTITPTIPIESHT